MYTGHSAYKIILHPLRKKIHLQKALEKNSGKLGSVCFSFSSLHFMRERRCCRLENPPLKSSSLGLRERLSVGLRVPVQTMLAVGLQIPRLAARFDGSKLRDWPFMCTRITSATYVHNLQRTTPMAFSRFSCVLSVLSACSLSLAKGLVIVLDQNRQLAYSTARGQWRYMFAPTASYVTLMMHSLVPRKLQSQHGESHLNADNTSL